MGRPNKKISIILRDEALFIQTSSLRISYIKSKVYRAQLIDTHKERRLNKTREKSSKIKEDGWSSDRIFSL